MTYIDLIAELSTDVSLHVMSLRADTVGVVSVDRDWSEGYGETWDYVEAPSCHACSGYAQWIDGDDLAEKILMRADRVEHLSRVARRPARKTRRALVSALMDLRSDMESCAWKCVDQTCERYGEEIDQHEGGAKGPMMSYMYPFPNCVSIDEYEARRQDREPPVVRRRDRSRIGPDLRAGPDRRRHGPVRRDLRGVHHARLPPAGGLLRARPQHDWSRRPGEDGWDDLCGQPGCKPHTARPATRGDGPCHDIDAYGERRHEEVHRDTWGHMDCAPGVKHYGTILFAESEFGGERVILRADFGEGAG